MNRNIRQCGFSLVEIMIGMVLALVLLGGLISLIVQSSKAHGVHTRLARVQENARFAVELLARDLRMAGYYGCVPRPGNIINHVPGAGGALTDAVHGLEGYEQGQTSWSPGGSNEKLDQLAADSDAVTVRFANPSQQAVLTQVVNATEIALSGGSGYRVGDVLVISDCDRAEVFQVTAVSGGSVVANALDNAYAAGAQLAPLWAARYFVGPSNLNSIPTLKRQVLQGGGGATTEELAQGVENLQLLYGEDTDRDGAPDVYRHANTVADWSRVISIQVGLLLRSLDAYGTGTERDSAKHQILDHVFDDPDDERYQRKVMSYTVFLRNVTAVGL